MLTDFFDVPAAVPDDRDRYHPARCRPAATGGPSAFEYCPEKLPGLLNGVVISAGLSTTQIWPFSRRRGFEQILPNILLGKGAARRSGRFPTSPGQRSRQRIPPLRSRCNRVNAIRRRRLRADARKAAQRFHAFELTATGLHQNGICARGSCIPEEHLYYLLFASSMRRAAR